jgi:hypothetical protein
MNVCRPGSLTWNVRDRHLDIRLVACADEDMEEGGWMHAARTPSAPSMRRILCASLRQPNWEMAGVSESCGRRSRQY